MNCGQCKCYEELPGPRDANDPSIGLCRRKPPMLVSHDDDGDPEFHWPVVTERDWCVKGFEMVGDSRQSRNKPMVNSNLELWPIQNERKMASPSK